MNGAEHLNAEGANTKRLKLDTMSQPTNSRGVADKKLYSHTSMSESDQRHSEVDDGDASRL